MEPLRAVRGVSEESWNQLKAVAAAEDRTMGEVLMDAIASYAKTVKPKRK